MIRRLMSYLWLICLSLAGTHAAQGHGGVVLEEDLCLIKMGYLEAHFKVYLPQTRQHEQYCEDLPEATEAVFVMEYSHSGLGAMPIDFRIIEDVTGLGRFARLSDVEAIDDLDAATVYYRAPSVDPDVYTVVHDFAQEGNFIGIVTVTDPESDARYISVFPFEVGFTGFAYWQLAVALAILVQLGYWTMTGRIRTWVSRLRPTHSASFVVAFMLAVGLSHESSAQTSCVSESGRLRIGVEPELEPIAINEIHSWVVRVATANGEPLEDATLTVSGGMPEHDHGLPTNPQQTRALGQGEFLVEGIRFHMHGYWEIVVTVEIGETEDSCVLQLTL